MNQIGKKVIRQNFGKLHWVPRHVSTKEKDLLALFVQVLLSITSILPDMVFIL